ncbi:MAG: hypothetical protein ACM3U2_22145, partial [Deltaproteobacteria bacterium]
SSSIEPADVRFSSVSAGTGPPVHHRHIPPWVLVVVGVLLFCLAFAVVAAIAVLTSRASRPVVRGLQERTMPDGTILVLEKVTVGTSHRFEWERKRSFTDWINGYGTGKWNAEAWAPGEAIVVWFSRRDAATGGCLDVDWWLRSAALDDRGGEIDDDNAGRNSFSSGANTGLSGSRPFSPEAPGRYELIVAHSALRPFRHSGDSFKLRVYNTKNEMVAEFDVPHTTPAPLPAWKSETLPATKKAGDLDVTLAKLGVDVGVSNGGSWTRKQYHLRPELRVVHDGRPETTPSVPEFEFEDVFSNTAQTWDCRLSFGEPAWKLKVRLWPGDLAPSDPWAEWSVPGVALPEAGKAGLIQQTDVIEGVKVEFIAAGGRDKVVYSDSAIGGGGGSSSYGGSFGGTTFDIESRVGRGVTTTTVNGKLPHLLLRVSGVDPDRRLAVRVRDEQGRNVPTQQATVSAHMVVILQPQPDVKTVDVKFVVQRPKKVEFFVKPPQVERKSEPGEPQRK